MLRAKHFIPPLIVLIVTLVLVQIFPKLWWLWAFLFMLLSSFLFLAGYLGRFALMDRLMQRQEWHRLAALCTPIIEKNRNPALQRIARLYLAAALIGQTTGEHDAPQLQRAEMLLEQIPIAQLPPRFRNRFHLIKGRLQLYQQQYAAALETLKQSSLQPVAAFHLTHLFYLFSVLFLLTNQELERSYNYAAKAFELNPHEPLFKAQYGLMLHLHRRQSEGMPLLREALAAMQPGLHAWEKKFYQQYLS